MSFLNSLPFKFLLPILLLGLQFSLKFFIDRRVSAYIFLSSLLEIPISILFLSLSLLAGYIIAGNGDLQTAFVLFVSILVMLIFCIFFWRRSTDHLDKKNFGYTTCLGITNLVLSLPTLLFVIYYIIETSL